MRALPTPLCCGYFRSGPEGPELEGVYTLVEHDFLTYMQSSLRFVDRQGSSKPPTDVRSLAVKAHHPAACAGLAS